MICENCEKRPATMRMSVRKEDGEQRMIMLCGMCAFRLTNVIPREARVGAAGSGDPGSPQVFNQHHFPTQRHGAFMGFSPQSQAVMRNAEQVARKLGLAYVGTMCLLIGVLNVDGPTAGILSKYGVRLPDLTDAASPTSDMDIDQDEGTKQLSLSQDALEVLKTARHQARGTLDDFIEPAHIVLAMLLMDKVNAARWMKSKGVDFGALEKELLDSLKKSRTETEITEMSLAEQVLGPEADSKAPGGNALEKYARDLTAMAEQGKLMPVTGRETELARVTRILSRLKKNNPILLGEAGVGKTAIVEALAERIVSGEVPRRLRGCRVYEVDLTAMIAGTEMRGEFEKRMKLLVDQVRAMGTTAILFIDEVHMLIGAGASEGSMDAGNIIKPSLARGELRLIGATTKDEYSRYIEKDPALARRFQPVLVGEPTMEQAIAILQGIKERFEKHHGVTLSDEAISAAVTLSSQYITDRFLPDKAIDLVDEACSTVAIENEEKSQSRAVIADDIADVISSATGIPLAKMIEPEKKRLLEMEKWLHTRIINQEEAVGLVSDVVRRARAGLKDPNKPNGAFMFAGPTGVGKTELARALAGFLFDDDSALVRLDMSEYMEKESVSRLIGAPPGYVGYEQGGQLTEKVKFKPYSVVLFDEMEKAHPQVLNLILQIADAGRLTDSKGREVNFKNTIIILTSNVGADLFFQAGPDFDFDEVKQQVKEMLVAATSPELVNRMDAVVVFRPLTTDQVQEVIKLQVGYLGRRCSDQSITLEVDPEAIAYLASKGYDPSMGARPAKRIIQDELESPLSEMIIGGTLTEGGTAKVTVKDGNLEISAG